MALTILEAAKLGQDTYRQGVVELFARSSDVLLNLPFSTIDSGSYRFNREGTLPSTAFRGINAAYTASEGVIQPATEQLTISGGDLDVDKALIRWNGADTRTVHESMKIKSLASAWGLKFVKGNSSTTVAEFDGLQTRLAGNQKIPAGTADGGDALSCAKLDEAISACEDPTHLLMTRAMQRRLTVYLRTVANLNSSRDEFGRMVTFYNDLPILLADRLNYADAQLDHVEATNHATATATGTSIYVLSMREDQLVGLQSAPMMVTDLGEQDAKPVMRTRIEWDTSIVLLNPRAAVRLWSISTGAVVA